VKRIFVLVMVLASLFLGGCSAPQKVTPTAKPRLRPTITATIKPTVTPAPIPDILSYLNEYYISQEESAEYQVEDPPKKGYRTGEYTMSLTLDEVPQANGTAVVNAKTGSSSVEIEFHFSNFLGTKVCAPSLIKAVTVATVKAIAEKQGIDSAEALANDVVTSYDNMKYTSIVNVGDYAFVFEPADTYAAVLSAINLSEFHAGFSPDTYTSVSHSDLSAKLNSGSKYNFTGLVKSCKSGQYRNSFALYKCLLVEVELETGEIVTVTQFPEKVPLTFKVGSTYSFYGTTMFDISNNLLFYLHYAK